MAVAIKALGRCAVVPEASVCSPCIGICSLDDDGRCQGCQRDLAQIAGWRGMDGPARRATMEGPLRQRLLQCRPFLARLPQRPALEQVLHRLDQPPAGPGWNHAQLADVLPPEPPKQAAVLVGLVPRPEGTQVLLTRRTEALRNHGGQVGFPGGRIEQADPHPVAAALRESNEEIGLQLAQVAPIGFLDPFITISNYRVLPVVAAVDPAFVPVPSPDEVDAVFEVPLAFLMDPANVNWREVEYRGRMRRLLEYSWPNEYIWGATAAMLFDLRQKLHPCGQEG